MKIVLLVASPQGSMCGVGDYTDRLAMAFRQNGADVSVEFLDRWSFAALRALRKRHGWGRGTVFHLQYPSLFMGRSLSPAFMPLMFRNIFVTLHEFSIFSRRRKLLFVSHGIFDKGIVFSSIEESDAFAGAFPWSRSRLSVLPIGMNIPRLASPADAGRTDRLVYFGQISLKKGIEFFIDTVERLRAAGNRMEVALIGALVERDRAFVDHVHASASRLGIALKLNLPPDVVSRELSDATIALLPFPGGVTNKRGSALACLDHGLTVLTTHSATTPAWLAEVTYPVSSPQAAADAIAALQSGDMPCDRAPEVLSRELSERDWGQIALAHLRLYEGAGAR